MTFIIRSELADQIKKISELEENKNLVSILLGTIDTENNEVIALSAFHFLNKNKETIELLDDDTINQIKALNKTIPYPMKSLGIVLYNSEELTSDILIELSNKLVELKQMVTIVNVKKSNFNYFSVSKENSSKLKVEQKDIGIENTLSVIHTIEFETKKEILTENIKLKESFVGGLNALWDKVTYNQSENTTIEEIIAEKRFLDRIVEINIPCDEKKLSSKTKSGNVFLAFDLHMNIYPQKNFKSKKLVDLKKFFNSALTQDLIVKLQRSYFDQELKSMIPPSKKRIRFYGLELNSYLSKKNPSKHEFELMNHLINHAKIMCKIGIGFPSRNLLLDLNEYFAVFQDKEKMSKIYEIMQEFSSI